MWHEMQKSLPCIKENLVISDDPIPPNKCTVLISFSNISRPQIEKSVDPNQLASSESTMFFIHVKTNSYTVDVLY